jgi:hypothetical protein
MKPLLFTPKMEPENVSYFIGLQVLSKAEAKIVIRSKRLGLLGGTCFDAKL